MKLGSTFSSKWLGFLLNNTPFGDIEVVSGLEEPVESILTSNVTTTIASIVDFELPTELNEWYEITGQITLNDGDNNGAIVQGNFLENGNVVGSYKQFTTNPTSGATQESVYFPSIKFKATGTTFTVSLTAGGSTTHQMNGNGTKGIGGSFLQLQKIGTKKKLKDLI